jgi:hypothetical protein
MIRLVVSVFVLAIVSGCSCGPAPVAAPQLVAFTDRIPGTSVEFSMIPIQGDGAVAPFYASSTEQTWDIYDVFVFNLDTETGDSTPESDAVTRPSKPYVLADRGYGHMGFAFLSASPKAIEQFLEWLRVKTGHPYRLPTVAELRYMLANSGVTAENLQEYAWVDENADWATHAVGSKPADQLGLHDLWGNLAEFAVTPEGDYVVLGGSWMDPASEISIDYEKPFTTTWNKDDPQIPQSVWWLASNDWVGVRVVCDPH